MADANGGGGVDLEWLAASGGLQAASLRYGARKNLHKSLRYSAS